MIRTLINDLKEGNESKISGWAKTIRNTKYMYFIILQDRSGSIQVSIEKENNEELTSKLEGILTDSIILETS